MKNFISSWHIIRSIVNPKNYKVKDGEIILYLEEEVSLYNMNGRIHWSFERDGIPRSGIESDPWSILDKFRKYGLY